ncbi:MAG: hypothetical protein WA012_09155 [Rhodoferax sp.]|uniref:hypothetical protein n=1 Tax=Rhodoferax sp. TaxID=50421 RepID=UPI003BAE90C7
MHASALSTFRFPENTCIPQAQPKAYAAVTEQSLLLEVMTDLASVKAATIDPHISLVVQAATPQDPARIRGVISPTPLERQLGRALPKAMPLH